MSAPAAFAKMYAASDTRLILGVPAKPPALRGKEEQRRERALIFVKKSEQAIRSLLRAWQGAMKKMFLRFGRWILNSYKVIQTILLGNVP